MDRGPSTIAVVDLGEFHAEGGPRPESAPPAPHFATRHLDGQTLVHRMVRRLSDSPLLQEVVVTGSHLPSSVLTSGLANTAVMDLPYSHVCERLAAAADRWQADWVVFVPANRPFVDPVLVDRLLAHARRAGDFDYVGYYSSGGGWRRMSHLGLAGEICHADALRRLRRNVDRLDPDTGDDALASWLQKAPGVYQMKFVPIPEELDREDLRFAVRDEWDWERAAMLSDYIRGDLTEWQPLADLVRENSTLREEMRCRNEVC